MVGTRIRVVTRYETALNRRTEYHGHLEIEGFPTWFKVATFGPPIFGCSSAVFISVT